MFEFFFCTFYGSITEIYCVIFARQVLLCLTCLLSHKFKTTIEYQKRILYGSVSDIYCRFVCFIFARQVLLCLTCLLSLARPEHIGASSFPFILAPLKISQFQQLLTFLEMRMPGCGGGFLSSMKKILSCGPRKSLPLLYVYWV